MKVLLIFAAVVLYIGKMSGTALVCKRKCKFYIISNLYYMHNTTLEESVDVTNFKHVLYFH